MKVATQNGDFELGATETTPTIGFTDFSRRVTDDFGVTTIVERGFSRRMSVKLGLPFDTVDAVHRRLADMRAAPALWVADDRFVWLSLYGYYKDFDIDLGTPPLSRCTLSVVGLAETGNVNDDGSDPALGQPSTLQLLQPMPVSDAVLAGSEVAENDAPEWAGGTAYGKRARVIRAATHRIYESLQAGNAGRTPESEPAWWLDLGPTNRWAMFDQALGTATSRNGGLEVTLNGGAANAVSLIDIVGDSVRVRANGYDQTQAVRSGALTFTGLPGSGQVTVNVIGAQAAVGTLLIGRMVGLGVTEAAPTAGITDFSRKETDDFGAVTIVERGFSKRMTARALIRSDALDLVADRIAKVRARPSLWIGQLGVEAITIYGFVKDFDIEVGTSVNKLSLTVEGLTKAAPIAAGVVTLVPRGPYDPATTYAAGALVEDQGVTWRYINATPTSGYAPPTLPTTRNGFWQVFSSVGMTPEQQDAFDKVQSALTAITSDNMIAAGGEKNQIIQLYAQVYDQSVRAHTASVQLGVTYGGDPTSTERTDRDFAMAALNNYLTTETVGWSDPNVDTAVDGPRLRGLFATAQATTNQLVQANSAFVRDRAKSALDRANAIGSDNVLSAGSEKQQTVIDWNTLYQDLESLYGKYTALGSPADLTPYVERASANRQALASYLGNLAPPWNQLNVDTPIASSDWSTAWQNAYNHINALRAQIAGRKGDKGDTGPTIVVSASPQVIRFSSDGVILSGPVTFRADLANLTGTVTWRSLAGHQIYDLPAHITFSGNTMTISADRMRDVLNYNESQTGSGAETIIAELNGVSHRVAVSKQLDGAKGLAGPGGYSHLAYANSADGTVDFHTSEAAGRRYLGSYTDQVEADSNDPARYTWTLTKGNTGDKGDKGDKGDQGDTVVGPKGDPVFGFVQEENPGPGQFDRQQWYQPAAKQMWYWLNGQWNKVGGLLAAQDLIASSAQLGTAVILSANIKDLEVDTIKIRRGAVTDTNIFEAGDAFIYANGEYLLAETPSTFLGADGYSRVMALFSCVLEPNSSDAGATISIYADYGNGPVFQRAFNAGVRASGGGSNAYFRLPITLPFTISATGSVKFTVYGRSFNLGGGTTSSYVRSIRIDILRGAR